MEKTQNSNAESLQDGTMPYPSAEDVERIEQTPYASGNIDRTYLDKDEEDEKEDSEDDTGLEDEEDWANDEFTAEPGTLPDGNPADLDDLELDLDEEDGDFLSVQDEDEDDA